MKLSTKPISSPGRTEKFPPPLMRFLRSNVGSRSRGRSRSSPMFLRKKSTAIETQEPSSPKVTCMGQVRVRRSSKQAAATRGRPARDPTPTRCRCRWIRNTLFCNCFSARIKPIPCQPVWPKWEFFRMGSFRKKATKVREDSTRTESNFRRSFNDESELEDHELREDEDERRPNGDANTNDFLCNYSTPPTNALLLTRCRSAPYRTSSLAGRFWGSPLKSEETGEEQRTEMENREQSDNEKPSTQRESISVQEGEIDPKDEEKLGFLKELEDSSREKIIKSENVEELKRRKKGEEEEGSARPLVLTRCKSEPARTAHKLDPQLNFWKEKRSGFTNSSSPHDL